MMNIQPKFVVLIISLLVTIIVSKHQRYNHHHLRNADIRNKAEEKISLSSQGTNPIDKYILEHIMNQLKFKGTFVEFGCADGITNSNT